MNHFANHKIFQLTTSQGGRLSLPSASKRTQFFQLTTSQGGRPDDPAQTAKNFTLSTHDLTRRSTHVFYAKLPVIHLSTHDLTRRSTSCAAVPFLCSSSFNSRPHKEVDQLHSEHMGCRKLSTHDLTRRSTFLCVEECEKCGLSTHDLTRRSTGHPYSKRTCLWFFQLTTSQGGRLPCYRHYPSD